MMTDTVDVEATFSDALSLGEPVVTTSSIAVFIAFLFITE
jgi:hypothetical protein